MFASNLLLLILPLITSSHPHNGSLDNIVTMAAITDQKRNCTNSFSVLEEVLLSNEKNRFNLLRVFFPPCGAPPVFLTVSYQFDEPQNQFDEFGKQSWNGTTVWYWSESEVYLIQPLDILQFTSLFHSNLQYRLSSLDLVLNQDCSNTQVEFMELLTQRLKLYAQTQRVSTSSEPLRISDQYLAVAASQDDVITESLQTTFVRIWFHLVLILFPIATVIVVYTCDPIQMLLGDQTWQKLRDENNHPRLAAVVQISIVFTVYVFVTDCFSFAYTLSSDLSHEGSGFYLTTLTGFVVDLAALFWVLFVFISSCHWNCRAILRGKLCDNVTSTRIHNLFVSVTIAPLLCAANHLPYVILSYISDPYHAGSVSMGYFLSLLLYYFVFARVYSRVVLRTGSRPKDFPYAVNADLVHFPDGDACRRKVRVPFNTQVVTLSLVIVTPLLVVYQGLIITLFWSLPIRKTLEDSPTRLYTTYQGTGFLIVALLTYNIVLRPAPFSFASAFDKLGKQLQIPQTLGRKWVRMGDEEKAAVVIRTLFASLGTTSPGGVAAGNESGNQEVTEVVIGEDVMPLTPISPALSSAMATLQQKGTHHHSNKATPLAATNSLQEEEKVENESETFAENENKESTV